MPNALIGHRDKKNINTIHCTKNKNDNVSNNVKSNNAFSILPKDSGQIGVFPTFIHSRTVTFYKVSLNLM